jgi:tetratricopeptide (TPR) repeat protein/predicted Ser/Thr protein kinase
MIGRKLAGYEIQEILGEGGMGVVYRALDPTLQRPLAIKVIRPEALGSQGKDRFLHEARACSRINHPNIVTVYAAGEEEGHPYLAMELLEGRTLREVIDEGPIPWEKAVLWMADILDALHRLHQEGIIHRDLKPENIIVLGDGTVKLMDFGIARVTSSATITTEGMTLGTVFYMSPEQAAGKPVDARSDLFSSGIVLYQMLTGKFPFEGEHPMSVMYAIQNEVPPSLSSLGVEVPGKLERALQRAMEKKPEKRYATTAEFREALLGIVRQEEAAREPGARWRSKRFLLGVVLPMAVVLVAGVIFVTLRIQDAREREVARQLAVQHNRLGEMYERRGELGEARREYRRAIEVDRTAVRPMYNLARLATEEGDEALADSLVRRATEVDPESYSYITALEHNERGHDYEVKGDLAGAGEEYRKAIEAVPEYEVPWNNLGVLAMRRGDWKAADSLLSKAVELEPHYSAALFNLGSLRWDQGKLTAAEGRFRAAVDSDSTFVSAYNNLGALLLDMGRVEEAQDVLETGLVRNEERKGQPDYGLYRASLLKHLGRAAEARGDREKAVALWRESLKSNPASAEVNEYLARALEESGSLDEARAHWERVIELAQEDEMRSRAEAALRRLGSP